MKKKKRFTNEIDRDINKKEELQKIGTLTLNYLKNSTDLMDINRISGQERTVPHFVRKYIVAIWLMNNYPPAVRSFINEVSNLDYKIINQIASHLNVILPKAIPGKRIDPNLLRKISDELQHEIDRYDLGLEPASLHKIGNRLGVNQSVISYWGDITYPSKYDEIWGRDKQWKVSEEERHSIIKRIKNEIQKYNNNQTPNSLSSIAKDFNRSDSSIRKVVENQFPGYYSLIWKVDYNLSTTQKKLLNERLDIEVKKLIPASLSEIGRNLKISYDMVRYYAKKQYPNSFNDIWGIPQLTSTEIEAIQARFEQEIQKFKKYEEKTIKYDEFTQKFDITKNAEFKPDPIIDIANGFNRSYDTISRIFTNTDSQKYDEIYAKPRITDEQLDSIVSDILCTKMPQTTIAEKHNVSTGTISRISIDKVQPNYDDYDHSERFPQDVYQQLGFAAHRIIQHVSTEHLLGYDIYKFSEISEGNYRIDDLLPPVELRKFYYELIMLNEERLSSWSKELIKAQKKGLSLWNDLGLDAYFEIVFEYTSYISQKQCKTKAHKYYKPKRGLLIVGTRWYNKKYPNPIINNRIKNVKIIRHDIFADLIGLSGDLRRDFEHAIELNYDYDLEGMIAFKKVITNKYTKFGFEEYKRYREKQK